MSLLNASIIPLSLIPECLYCPFVRHPGNLQAGVQKYLKNTEKAKTWIPD